MELNERILLILQENSFKQKDFANLMGVSESYISTLLSGKNKGVSTSFAGLVQEKLGYSSDWILTGQEPKLKSISKNPRLSDVQKRAILQIEKMSEKQIKAALVFLNSLDEIEGIFKGEG